MSIIIQSLSYTHPDRELLFQHISFSVPKGQKVALVGNNGTGKSTLLKIIAGRLQPSEGEATSSEKPYYVPQHVGQYDAFTIAQALGVDEKLRALHEILSGNVSPENLTRLDDDWDMEERVQAAFSFWNIEHLELSQPMKLLSGGEKTKVFLSGIAIYSPKIILLDEPSNHLDTKSRSILYNFIKKAKETILVVSHDRTLLNLLDVTFELSKDTIEAYGGNYDFYKEQKDVKLLALQAQAEEKEKVLKQTQQKAREIAEQQQKKEARGKARTQKAALPRIVAGGLQSKAEQSSAKLKDSQNEKINDISDSLKQIRQQIQEQKVLRIDLKKSDVHRRKMLVSAKDINFSYGEKMLWKDALTFEIRSGDRVRIEGNNGIGKTTLTKLLTGGLQPSTGDIFIANFQCLYIDQEYSMLDGQLSIFEQVQKFNDRHMPEHELKMLLHYHQFPRETWDRKSEALSGGEKMKLILCCAAVSNNTPDLLVLDEPTNNLDTYSQEILTETVKNFTGAVLVISHDQYFVREINADKNIALY